MTRFSLMAYLAAGVLMQAADSSTFAATALVLETDHTQMIAVASAPGTVVVGNPAIADVSVNGKQIFLHGHAFGETSILVLDANGGPLANFDVTVGHNTSNAVAMFSSHPGTGVHAVRFSYSCAPNCEADLMPGDEDGFSKNISTQDMTKSGFAHGDRAVDAKTPAAPLQ